MYCPVCRAEYPDDYKVCPKDATSLLRGAQIGKYKIEGLLGLGGMGAVYRAVNPDTKGRVAIKIMNPAVASADSARARFQREAASVAALRTSHVVKVFDFGTDDGTLYLVMELLDGHTLREEIQPAPDTMDLARVQMVIDGALKGLAAAHKAGIVHRDLKPENVYVADTDDGEVPKLLDFGIARMRNKDSDLTMTGALMGTAGYMAIEQVAPDAGEIGPWTDVYAMGAILYEMLAGSAACGGDTVTSVLQKVLSHDIAPLQSVRPGLPPAVYALLDRCLAEDPTKRPQDAEAMRAAFATARLVATGTEVPPPTMTQKLGTSQVGLLATTPSKDSAPRTPSRPSGAAPAGKKPLKLIALVALAGVGGVAAFLAVSKLNKKHAEEHADAGIVAAVPEAGHPMAADAAVATPPATPDAVAVPAVDAAATDPKAEMVRIAAGEHALGEPKSARRDALAATKVVLPELWIDRTEMTLGALRAALGDPKAGGAPGDGPDLPARFVTWSQAAAACKALGKRLPHETEWEAAALTTPQDLAKAALMRGTAALVASPRTECSAEGLCDMLGSVLEWTADDWPRSKGTKIARGSSFKVSPDAGWQASIHFRVAAPASKADEEVGVRCVIGDEPPRAAVPVRPPPPKAPPCDPAALFEETRTANKAGKYEEAIAAAKRALACNPGDPLIEGAITFAACKSGNTKVALAHYKLALPGRLPALRQNCRKMGIDLP